MAQGTHRVGVLAVGFEMRDDEFERLILLCYFKKVGLSCRSEAETSTQAKPFGRSSEPELCRCLRFAAT